jgi:hypothetical protein
MVRLYREGRLPPEVMRKLEKSTAFLLSAIHEGVEEATAEMKHRSSVAHRDGDTAGENIWDCIATVFQTMPAARRGDREN